MDAAQRAEPLLFVGDDAEAAALRDGGGTAARNDDAVRAGGEEIGGAGQHVASVAGQAQAYLVLPEPGGAASGEHHADHAILPSPAKTVNRCSRGRQKPRMVTGWAGCFRFCSRAISTGVDVTALRLIRNEKPARRALA